MMFVGMKKTCTRWSSCCAARAALKSERVAVSSSACLEVTDSEVCPEPRADCAASILLVQKAT